MMDKHTRLGRSITSLRYLATILLLWHRFSMLLTMVKSLLKCTDRIFFFFQAEDGIRDYKVTGVQTCALPISGDVATRPRETGHEPVSDRIAHDRHDDGDRGGRLPYCTGRWRIQREDEVDLETGQLGRQTREPLDLPIGPSVLDEDVLTLHVAVFAQALPEGVERHPRLGRFERTGHQVTDPCDSRRWLCLGEVDGGQHQGYQDAGP